MTIPPQERPKQTFRDEITVSGGEHAFFSAIFEGNLKEVKDCLAAGDKVDQWVEESNGKIHITPLFLATQALQRTSPDELEERREIVKAMLERPDAKGALNHKFPQFGNRDLVGFIAENGNTEAAKLLLDKKYAHLLTHEQRAELEAVQLRANKRGQAGALSVTEAAQQSAQLDTNDIEAQGGKGRGGWLGIG